jgi:hypothetical protein
MKVTYHNDNIEKHADLIYTICIYGIYTIEAPMVVAVDTSKISAKTPAWKRVGDIETNTNNTGK